MTRRMLRPAHPAPTGEGTSSPARRGLTTLLVVTALVLSACGADAATSSPSGSSPPGSSTPTSSPTSAATEPVATEAEPEATEAGADAGPNASGSVERDFTAVGGIVEDHVADRGLGGAGLVVVDADDGIVYQGYWGDFDADRVSLVASTTKQITALVLLRLHEEGVLDVDQPIAEIVGDAWGDGGDLGNRTIAQMVSNSSGMVGLAPNPAYPPYLCQFLPDEELESCARSIYTTPNDDDDLIAPDTEFRYGGAQWQLAGGVAEVASGQTWDELVQRILVEPCGLGDDFGYTNHWTSLSGAAVGYPTGFDGSDLSVLPDTDNPHMEGGVFVSPADYAQLLLLHLRGGRCPDGTVLSPETLSIAHRDRAAAWGGDTGQPDGGYGYGWFHDRTTGRLSDPGAYGSVAWLDLDAGYGVYLVLEASGGGGGDGFRSELEARVHDVMTGAS